MKTIKDFYQGQRVKMYDKDDSCNVYGHILEVREKSILVKWNDLHDPVEHLEDEFSEIKDGIPAA